MHVKLHDVLENVINDLAKREIYKTSSTIPCTEKWSEYYTCKEREDEVNRKGYLTKPQEAVYVEIDKNNF